VTTQTPKCEEKTFFFHFIIFYYFLEKFCMYEKWDVM